MGRTLRSLPVKAFAVPPLSRQQVPGQGLASELMPRIRRPGDDDQALNMARADRGGGFGGFGGRSLGLSSAYTRN